MQRRASIDIGSNSVKLLVLDIDGPSYRIVHDSHEVTGLGSGLGEGGALNSAAFDLTAASIARMAETARSLGARDIVAAGTSALRRASDAPKFIDTVHTQAGVEIEILDEHAESRLGRAIALREIDGYTGNVLFFDVGGGSTELSLLQDGATLFEGSVPLGARRLAESAGLAQPPEMEDLLAAVETADTVLSARLGSLPFGNRAGLRVAGLGGTATALVWMVYGAADSLPDPHLKRLSRNQLDAALESLGSKSLESVGHLPGMDPRRAPVFLAGVLIISRILRYCGADGFTLTDRGLRFGLLLA